MWCGNRDKGVVDNGSKSYHEACMNEAGRRIHDGQCSLCGRELPEGCSDSCGNDDCFIKGYPP